MHPALKVIFLGILLLLPGVCGAFFMGALAVGDSGSAGFIASIALLSIAVGVCGIFLILCVVRKRR